MRLLRRQRHLLPGHNAAGRLLELLLRRSHHLVYGLLRWHRKLCIHRLPVVRQLEPAELVRHTDGPPLRLYHVRGQGGMLTTGAASSELPLPAWLQIRSVILAAVIGGALWAAFRPLLGVPARDVHFWAGAILALLAGASSFWAP
jgi:hypothetical protein